MSNNFVNYAHRGASTYAPENTLTSFRMGLEMGANGIETDVQITKDGVLVLFHDNTIERCSNGTGRIADYTYAQLLQMDFGGWKDEKYKGEPIMTIEDFAREFFPLDLTFAIELKVRGIAAKVADIINRYKVADKVIVSSFDFACLEEMKAAAPDQRLCWLIIGEIDGERLSKLRELNPPEGSQISPKCADLTEAGIELAKSYGFRVRLWGTDSPETMEKVYPFDTDGMTVNFPDKLTALMQRKPRF